VFDLYFCLTYDLITQHNENVSTQSLYLAISLAFP